MALADAGYTRTEIAAKLDLLYHRVAGVLKRAGRQMPNQTAIVQSARIRALNKARGEATRVKVRDLDDQGRRRAEIAAERRAVADQSRRELRKYLVEQRDGSVEAALQFGQGECRTESEGIVVDPHLAQQPGDGFFDSYPEQVVAGRGISPIAQADELGVVVEHFFEMRHQPFGIG